MDKSTDVPLFDFPVVNCLTFEVGEARTTDAAHGVGRDNPLAWSGTIDASLA